MLLQSTFPLTCYLDIQFHLLTERGGKEGGGGRERGDKEGERGREGGGRRERGDKEGEREGGKEGRIKTEIYNIEHKATNDGMPSELTVLSSQGHRVVNSDVHATYTHLITLLKSQIILLSHPFNLS